jgi:hypothetical protein
MELGHSEKIERSKKFGYSEKFKQSKNVRKIEAAEEHRKIAPAGPVQKIGQIGQHQG